MNDEDKINARIFFAIIFFAIIGIVFWILQ